MKRVHVALVGYGNIGTGFCANLHENHDLIVERTGIDIRLKYVCDIDFERERWFKVPPSKCVRDYKVVEDDPEVDIVVELVGGTTVAKRIILRAFEKGKHVVTANKALLATHGREIFQSAREHKKLIRFEASVGGGIPNIKALMEGLASNYIESIAGIVNGTTNYILTRMTLDGMSFDDALHIAKEKGFAEPNPKFDVEGIDPSHKITILSSLASGKMVNLEDVYVEGIGGIEHVDIEIATMLEAVIKPLVVFRNSNEGVDARVHPMIVPKTHKLAFVNENYNIIYIKGNFVGVTGFYGLGAGSVPTSSAVVGDTIDIAKALDSNAEIRQYGIPDLNSTAKVIPIERTANSYCVRLKTKDIESVRVEFESHKIEIEKQMEVEGYKIFVTGTTVEHKFKRLLDKLSSHHAISSKPSYLRFFNLEL